MENSAALVRLGGVCGVLFVVLLVPGVFAARPDVSDASLSAQQALEYLEDKHGALMIGNGLSFIFAAFFSYGSWVCCTACYGAPRARKAVSLPSHWEEE